MPVLFISSYIPLIGDTGNRLDIIDLRKTDTQLLDVFHIMNLQFDASFKYSVFRFYQKPDNIDIKLFRDDFRDLIQYA